MAEEHPNLSLIRRLDLRDLTSAATLFSENVVWRYFNPLLPEIHGDYVGLSGIQSFFGKTGAWQRHRRSVGAMRPLSRILKRTETWLVHYLYIAGLKESSRVKASSAWMPIDLSTSPPSCRLASKVSDTATVAPASSSSSQRRWF